MTLGPGKYDDLATLVREQADAEMVMVAVFKGNRGNGFSVQTTDPVHMLRVIDILDNIVRQLREDMQVT